MNRKTLSLLIVGLVVIAAIAVAVVLTSGREDSSAKRDAAAKMATAPKQEVAAKKDAAPKMATEPKMDGGAKKDAVKKDGATPSAEKKAADTAIVSTEEALGEMSLGSKDAPVVIYAFESLTCPHCRAFHKSAYEQIKKTYVETGKVRIVFKDYPLNAQAFYGTLVARCLGPARYVGMVEILFENQARWGGLGGQEFLQTLGQYARLAGMTDDDFKKCIANGALIKGVQAAQKVAQDKYKVESTPTFVIGTPKTVDTDQAQRIEGEAPFEDFEKIIEPLLSKPDKK